MSSGKSKEQCCDGNQKQCREQATGTDAEGRRTGCSRRPSGRGSSSHLRHLANLQRARQQPSKQLEHRAAAFSSQSAARRTTEEAEAGAELT